MFHNGTDEVVGQAVANSAGTTWSVGLRTDFVGVRLVYVLVDGTVLDSSPFFLEVKVPACPAGQVPQSSALPQATDFHEPPNEDRMPRCADHVSRAR